VLLLLQRLVELLDVSLYLAQDASETKMALANIGDLVQHHMHFGFVLQLLLWLQVAGHHSLIYFILQVEHILVIQGFSHNIMGKGFEPLSDDGVFAALLLT